MSEFVPVGVTIANIRRRIEHASAASGRPAADVRLLLASKTQPPAAVLDAYAAGERLFGENRVQEAVPKIIELASLNAEWHFIGHLQTNKVKDILPLVRCIQSVDRASLITELARQTEKLNMAVDVLVEINTSGEASKSGCRPLEVPALLASLATYPRLRVRGFMTIGALTTDATSIRHCFILLRRIAEEARHNGLVPHDATELSMGMSSDLEIAIQEGSTMIRVGSAIFGERT